MKKITKNKRSGARLGNKTASKPVNGSSTLSAPAVQDERYWAERPLNDPNFDWKNKENAQNWILDYWHSRFHPHRNLILGELLKIPFYNLLEVGCNCGPNLARIHDKFRGRELAGIDPNPDAVALAQDLIGNPLVEVRQGSVLSLPYESQSFDVVLSDAALLYISPQEIDTAMREIDRVARKAVILVERYADSLLGEVVGHVWGRDYAEWLKMYGFNVRKIKINKKHWSTSANWQKHGYVFIGVRAR